MGFLLLLFYHYGLCVVRFVIRDSPIVWSLQGFRFFWDSVSVVESSFSFSVRRHFESCKFR